MAQRHEGCACRRPAASRVGLGESRHTSQVLEELSGQLFRLAAFFGPQHGFLGQTQDNNGRSYIRWLGGSLYGFAKAPVGRHGEALISRRSCAISQRNHFLHQHDKLRIESETVKSQIRSEEWIVTDSGPAVHRLQIDLYWGEDEPRGAVGRQPARPAGTWMEYAFETSVAVKR